jgi:hypothetical protein
MGQISDVQGRLQLIGVFWRERLEYAMLSTMRYMIDSIVWSFMKSLKLDMIKRRERIVSAHDVQMCVRSREARIGHGSRILYSVTRLLHQISDNCDVIRAISESLFPF